MQLPVQLAKSRVSKKNATHFDRFEREVQAGRYAPALIALQSASQDPLAKAWAQVLRGQLAGLHTQACLNGQWLRFAPYHPKDTTQVSMITLLDELSKLSGHTDPVLANQAQIAQVRIMAIAQDCPGSRSVQERARTRLPVVLGTLADAQGPSLPPDLAYLRATLALEQEQWGDTRRWLAVARNQGLDDPRTTLALAQSWFGQRNWARAQSLATQSAKAMPKTVEPLRAAAWTLAARAAWAQGHATHAKALLKQARLAQPHHADALALVLRMHASTPLSCQGPLAKEIGQIWNLSWSAPPELFWTFDELLSRLDQPDPDPLGCLAAFLIWNVDEEPDPALRAIRYYYAATLDARLGDPESALGHALLARSEFELAGSPRHPLPIEALIDAMNAELSR